MAAIDTLEILIEANAQGLTSQLKRATDSITSFVSSMNKQEVDWTSILSRTISPAVISGVAALFATAISQSLQFSQTVAQTAAQSTSTFQDGADKVGQSALNISNTTGASAGSVAQALGIAAKSFSDLALQQLVVTDASMLSERGFGSLTDVTKQLSDVLVAWGINSVGAGSDALDKLIVSSNNSKLSFSDFVSTITSNGPALKDVLSFQDAVTGLAAFSKETGVTKTVAIDSFTAIAKAAQDPLDQMNILAGGPGKIAEALKSGGIIEGFQLVGETINKYPTVAAQLLGKQMGLTADSVSTFRDLSVKDLQDVAAEQQKLIANQQTISGLFDNSKSVLSEFFRFITNAWNAIIALFQNPQKTAGGILGIAGDLSQGPSGISDLLGKGAEGIMGLLGGGSKVNSETSQGGGPSNNSFSNTFNINVPPGGENSVPQNIIKELYQQFQNK